MNKTLGEAADQHQPKSKVKNIAELQSVDITSIVQEETEAEFPYMFIQVEGERYKLTTSILQNIKVLRQANPNIKHIRVTKTGTGMDTRYVVIPLD